MPECAWFVDAKTWNRCCTCARSSKLWCCASESECRCDRWGDSKWRRPLCSRKILCCGLCGSYEWCCTEQQLIVTDTGKCWDSSSTEQVCCWTVEYECKCNADT